MRPIEHEDLLANLKKAKRLNLLSNWLIATIILSAFPLFIISTIAGVILKYSVRTKLIIGMDYTFDSESQATYDALANIWMYLSESEILWQSNSRALLNKKTSGGALYGIRRTPVKVTRKLPVYVSSNLQIYSLKLPQCKIYFFPDKVLIETWTTIGMVKYSDLTIGLDTMRFVEEDTVPKDAKVVDTTWLKVNKDGSPDKRYNNNKQLPVCEYGEILIQSEPSFHVELLCSNSNVINKMRSSAEKFLELAKQNSIKS